ncbi:Tip elongation aberrant protein 1 [Choanephora cucurbitarum]|uniref:Tip elongation aberrant protein 1 n=1 Tax=Choanephora cucurbitarum TaxID=101091 RepID=A0A1C7NM47_9FUNG|nr:Tip elongation aberrant protein 1 [Choanephora cucurbitarum]
MSLFSKLAKGNDKTLYPWSQKKLGGSNHCLPRSAHAATVVQPDAIVIFGGVHKASQKKELFYIDTNNNSANSISTTGDIPAARVAPIMVTLNGQVILYGGRPLVPEEKYDGSIYVLNLHAKQWTRIQPEGPQPSERSGHSVATQDNAMFIFGGQKEGHYFNDLYVFNSDTLSTGPRWEQLTFNNKAGDCPEPRSGHVSVIFDNKLYIFGGTDGQHMLNDLWAFDLHSRVWARVESEGLMPAARESSGCAMVDGVMYIFGGRGEHGAELNDLCAFRMRTRRWFRFQNMGPSPSPRHGLTMTAIRERLFVVGGENDISKMDDSSSLYILDSSKIKYPTDTLLTQQSTESTQPTQSAEPMIEDQHSQPSPVQHQQVYPQKPFTDPRQQQPSRPYPPQNAPQGQNSIQVSIPPVRPPRHISTVPEAVLRRPRATSPLLQNDSEIVVDARRPYPSNVSPTSPVSIENELMRASPIQTNIMAATDEAMDPNQQQRSFQQALAQNSIRASPVNASTPPPRPPREGVGLGNTSRTATPDLVRNQSIPAAQLQPSQLEGSHSNPSHSPEPSYAIPERSPSRTAAPVATAATAASVMRPQPDTGAAAVAAAAAAAAAAEERQMLLREIQSRDNIINEMKQKENWWRTEVSLARKQQASRGEGFDGPEADESLLMDVDHLPEDKVKLFEQLISVKSELRRVKTSILQQAQPMSDKVHQADRMRTAALQEAAYFKSKYLALKSRRQQDLGQIEISRCDELEKRLALALSENEANAKMLQQLQKRSQHDQVARTATEERAREAQERAEEAQDAHQRALEELQVVYARATKAELQVRDNAMKIADLTQQLSEALLSQPAVISQDVTEAQMKASQLEAANLRARNETASLKQKLADQMDDIDRLRTALNEREDALAEARRHVEDYEIQLNMMRDAMNQQPNTNTTNTINGYAPTRAY